MSAPQTKGERSSLSPPWAAGPAKSRSPHSTTATTFPPGLAWPGRGPRTPQTPRPRPGNAPQRAPRGEESLAPSDSVRRGPGVAPPDPNLRDGRRGRAAAPRLGPAAPRPRPLSGGGAPPAPHLGSVARDGEVRASASPVARRRPPPSSLPPRSGPPPRCPRRPRQPGHVPAQRRAGALRAQPPRGSAPRPRSAGPGPPGPLSRVAAGAGVTADNGPRYCRQPRAGPDGRSSFGAKPGGGRVCRALPAAPRRPVTAAEKRDSALTSPRLFSPLASTCRPPHDAPPRTAALEPKAAARPSREAVTPGVRSLSVPSGADVAPARQPPRCCPRAGCPR